MGDPPKKRAPAEAGALIACCDDHILPFVQVFVESSHFMWAFSQPALVGRHLGSSKARSRKGDGQANGHDDRKDLLHLGSPLLVNATFW